MIPRRGIRSFAMNTPPVPIDGYGNVSHAVEHDLLGDMVITAAINTDTSAHSQTLARPSGSSSTNLPSEAKLLRCISSPRETFTPIFDDDGNQTLVKTATGIWSVTYNGENCVVSYLAYAIGGNDLFYLESAAVFDMPCDKAKSTPGLWSVYPNFERRFYYKDWR